MRLMTYNIKNGGGSRLAAIAGVVTDAAPDILSLQELRGFTRWRDRILTEFAEAVGMRPFPARPWSGQPVALFVRPAIEVIEAGAIRRPFHHAAVRVVVRTDRGPLAVICAHLCPYSGNRRLREVRWLIAQARRDRLAVVTGDLNSLDPWTDHSGPLAALPIGYRGRHLRGDGSTVDTRAIAALDSAGLVDLWRRVGGEGRDHTVPTECGGGHEFSALRLDYVLATEEVAALARDCRVLDGGDRESASDHYPVTVTLDLQPAVP